MSLVSVLTKFCRLEPAFAPPAVAVLTVAEPDNELDVLSVNAARSVMLPLSL